MFLTAATLILGCRRKALPAAPPVTPLSYVRQQLIEAPQFGITPISHTALTAACIQKTKTQEAFGVVKFPKESQSLSPSSYTSTEQPR